MTTAGTWSRSRARLAARLGAGALVAFVGIDHYYEYAFEHYSVLPTIGTLFLLNFIGATACGLLLLAPLEWLSPRFGRPAVWLAALGGFGIGATSLICLLVSEQTPLFGYMELNYRPAVLVGLCSEGASAALCAALLVLDLRAEHRDRRAFAGTGGEPRTSHQSAEVWRPATGASTRDEPGRDARATTAASSS